MADFEQKDNSGAIFKNDKKGDNTKAPDYKGKAVVDGAEKEMALWLKTSKAGKTYMSIAFSEPYNKDGSSVNASSKSSPVDDDKPF